MVTSADKQKRQILFSVFLTVFLDLVGFGMFIPIIPLVARQFGASDAGAAAVASLFSLGTLLAVAALGRLSDRRGRRPIMIGTVAVSCIAQVATGFAPNYVALLVSRFMAGVASGNISVAQACISDITKAEERGRSMALIGMAFGLGFALGPALGALCSFFYPDQSLLAIGCVAGLLNLFNLLVVARRLPETHPRFTSAEILAFGSGHSPKELEFKKQNFVRDLQLLLRKGAFGAVLVIGFLQIFAFIGIESILSLMLHDAFAITERRDQYLAFMFIGFMLVFFNGGVVRPLLRKLGEVRTLNIGQLLLMVSMLAFPLVAPDKHLLYATLFLMSAGSAFSNPALSALTSRLAPGSMQGYALGTAQTLGALARIVGPVAFGSLYQLLQGPRSLFASAAILFCGWLYAVIGLKETHLLFKAERKGAESR